LFNHIVSAIHAALIVRADNRAGAPALQESRLQFRLDGVSPEGLTPSATLSLRF
jgi:hypothetical protein